MRMQIGGPKLTVLELLPEKFMGFLSLRAGVDSGEVLFYDPQSRDCLPAAHAENIVLPETSYVAPQRGQITVRR
jgi:hypothetical protein